MENRSLSGFVRYQLPVILWALLIFGSSSVPGWVFPHVGYSHADKVVHFCYYFVFAILLARALRHQSRSSMVSRFSLSLTFLFTVAYGVSDELHQLFVAERSSDPRDLLADAVGALVAVVILAAKRKLTREPETSEQAGKGS